jgi:hypothetical protein
VHKKLRNTAGFVDKRRKIAFLCGGFTKIKNLFGTYRQTKMLCYNTKYTCDFDKAKGGGTDGCLFL